MFHRAMLLFCLLYCPYMGLAATDSLLHHSIYHANLLSVHPFGIFISRINNNFQLKADRKPSITLNLSNGNVWLPFVKAYTPVNQADREELSKYAWHRKEIYFDETSMPSKTTEFQADGVIRQYQIKLNVPFLENHELKVNARMFSLDGGKAPFSSITSDRFIEWVHSNVAGGEDPFARKEHEFDQAEIRFQDKNGRMMKLDNGDFVFSGIDFSYYYYPEIKGLSKYKIHTNVGLQVGLNTTHVNTSIDIGMNASTIKKIDLKNKSQLHIGFSLNAFRLRALQSKNGVELFNNKLLFGSEFFLEYLKRTKKGNAFSIATTYTIQSAYNRKDDFDNIVLTGDRASSHWHYALSHLYRKLTANYLVLTYSRKTFDYSVYLRQDLRVDNAPDIQVGFGLKVNFE